ncbi:hypothetical protein [Mycobacterium angelicum]|uniref:HipA-like C-terminal domain-containing protein n=1 Tax=Mycobacterium angelicum TaxID=470074 RepID=A0A1W9ZTR0_MYCAN|nr:hypothetical protein [Mycobacterium angelicum]MCV7198172.1 hypothetical protein [Mycobacterium angelicum]ORA21180.1 hypothetical protein BST12_13305 [Mycobacterium angelicum]
MVDTFEVVDLADWTRGESEPGGDEAKRWFVAPEASRHAGHWLFKPRRIKALKLSKRRRLLGDEPDVLVRGENWAEKVSYELAKLLLVPAAETELATVVQLRTHQRVYGSMSRDMRPRTWAWTPGAALLAERDDAFDAKLCRGHTIAAIDAALEGLRGPVNTEYVDWSAFDVFAGYLLLDAWIANTDRHAHNWGVLQNPKDGAICLGPSFDHGSALASGDGDPARADRVRENTVEQWCQHGRTKRFDGGVPSGLVDIAGRALALAGSNARRHWTSQINNVDLDLCFDVVAAVPDLSDPTRSFLRTVLATNRKRLCHALG